MSLNLKIDGLTKVYDNGVKALDNFSLEIPCGMFGLLGPNGAGKSTLMRTIATLQNADEGEINLGEIDVLRQKQEVRKILGYLPQEFGLYPKVKAEHLLNHIAILKGITDKNERRIIVENLLERTNLLEHRFKKLDTFSGGMKQRFGIAQALLANPKLIIVDEPTAGLDPSERNRFHNLLSEIGESTIVILSTHIVEDVKELCTQMAIINKGRLLLTGSPVKAIDAIKGKIYSKTISKGELIENRAKYKVIAEKLWQGEHVIHAYSDTPIDDGFELVNPDLSDVYFSKIYDSNNN